MPDLNTYKLQEWRYSQHTCTKCDKRNINTKPRYRNRIENLETSDYQNTGLSIL